MTDPAAPPRTEAGRELHGGHCRTPERCDYLASIRRIEAEAAAAAVRAERERLREAVEGLPAGVYTGTFDQGNLEADYLVNRADVLDLLTPPDTAP